MTEEQYNDMLHPRWLKNTGRVLEVLTHIIPASCSSRHEIAMLGSAALALLQEQDRIGPMWGNPSDYDFFVSGRFGRNETVFKNFMVRCITRLTDRGYAVTSRQTKVAYARNGGKILIFDLTVAGLVGKLSFIQSPECDNVEEVAKQFDIDVCRVIYNIHECKLYCTKSVHEHIKRKVAVVSWVRFRDSGLSKDDIIQVQRVMARIVKYKERGFKFLNDEGVSFVRLPRKRR
jgi:hypothetical protein